MRARNKVSLSYQFVALLDDIVANVFIVAGNIESHSTLDDGESVANITAVLDDKHYGFSKLSVVSAQELKWQFVRGDGGVVGDELTLLKKKDTSCKTKHK